MVSRYYLCIKVNNKHNYDIYKHNYDIYKHNYDIYNIIVYNLKL